MFSAGLFCIMGAALLTDDGGQRGADMGMDMNFREDMCRIFNKYAGAMKVRSLKWYSRGGGKTADRAGKIGRNFSKNFAGGTGFS